MARAYRLEVADREEMIGHWRDAIPHQRAVMPVPAPSQQDDSGTDVCDEDEFAGLEWVSCPDSFALKALFSPTATTQKK